MRSVAILATVAAVASANRLSTSWMTARRLEDANNNGYVGDFSSYTMQFGQCARVKVPSNDDDGEGNSYFANGRYHAQYQQYASFFLCQDNGDATCSCDYTIEYVTDLQTYLEQSVEYIQGMCEACSASCRRRLEEGEDKEEEEAYQYQLDCSTCAKVCSSMTSNNGGVDEADYLECQEAYEDEENGIQYYSAPKCDSNGNIVIGLFYDDECTVKTTASYDAGFDYSTFKTIESSCLSCADGLCEELYNDAVYCQDGNTLSNNNDDMPICKTFNNAYRTYEKRKKELKILPFVIIGLVTVGFIVSASYTYYVRHSRKATTPLANLDQTADHTDLPPIS